MHTTTSSSTYTPKVTLHTTCIACYLLLHVLEVEGMAYRIPCILHTTGNPTYYLHCMLLATPCTRGGWYLRRVIGGVSLHTHYSAYYVLCTDALMVWYTVYLYTLHHR